MARSEVDTMVSTCLEPILAFRLACLQWGTNPYTTWRLPLNKDTSSTGAYTQTHSTLYIPAPDTCTLTWIGLGALSSNCCHWTHTEERAGWKALSSWDLTLRSHLDLVLGSKNSAQPAPTCAMRRRKCLLAAELKQRIKQTWNAIRRLHSYSTPNVNSLECFRPRWIAAMVGASSDTWPSDIKKMERGGRVDVSGMPAFWVWSERRKKECKGFQTSVVPMVAEHFCIK